MRRTQRIGPGYGWGLLWGLVFGGVYLILSLVNTFLMFRPNPKTANLRYELDRRLLTASYRDQNDNLARFGFEDAVKLWVIVGIGAFTLLISSVAR